MRLTPISKLIPWLTALGYLYLIGSLGWAFHQIETYRIDHISIADSSGQLSDVPLGYFRAVERYPDTTQLSLTFDTPEHDRPLAVFLPRLSSDIQVSVNQQVLQVERISYKAKNVYRPLLIPIPDQALRNGQSNTLDIRLQAHGPVMVLSKFYLGPQASLEPVYRYFYFFRHDLVISTFAITLLIAVFIFTIALVRSQFNEYVWLALAFLAFAYHLFSFIRVSEPEYFQLYTWSYLFARAVFFWAFVLFIHRFLQYHRRWLENLLGGFFVLVFAAGLVMIANDQYRDFLSLTFFTSLPMVLLVIAYVSVVLLHALLKNRHVYLHWLLAGSLFGLLLGIHDILVLFDVQHLLVRDFYIAHYAILFMAAGYGGVLVHRVALALLNSEDLNLELNRLLKIKTRELEQASQQRLQQEKQLTLYAERQRIMADMHDGVGGQLVSLLAASRDGELNQQAVTSELDQILADLRLVLDALTPAGEELITALARLKERYTPLLAHAGIQLEWRIDSDIEAIPMPPSLTINALRLVQEAIQNSIKHANPSNIRLQLERADNGYRLVIEDDGAGIGNNAAGHGTSTMQQRAIAVHGQLSISSPPDGGTRVILNFPAQPRS